MALLSVPFGSSGPSPQLFALLLFHIFVISIQSTARASVEFLYRIASFAVFRAANDTGLWSGFFVRRKDV